MNQTTIQLFCEPPYTNQTIQPYNHAIIQLTIQPYNYSVNHHTTSQTTNHTTIQPYNYTIKTIIPRTTKATNQTIIPRTTKQQTRQPAIQLYNHTTIVLYNQGIIALYNKPENQTYNHTTIHFYQPYNFLEFAGTMGVEGWMGYCVKKRALGSILSISDPLLP